MSKEKIKTRKCIECKEEFYSNYDKSEVCPTCHYKNKQKEKDKQISDLEAKLAEMTEKYNACQEARKLEIEFSQQDKAQLKQQLADKEKIIDWQNEIVEGVKQEEELLAQKLKSLGVDCIEDLGKEHNQNKISFCIEHINRFKDFILNNIYLTNNGDEERINKYFDNQIEQLKKEMK